jgi:RNA polymerase sigma-70 factor (ECF subfamily)
LDGEPDKHEEAQWDIDFQRRLFDWAAQRVRNEFEAPTWQAFWQTAVEALPAKAVAERLGMTLGAVYVAKSRVISRLRLCIQEACDE